MKGVIENTLSMLYLVENVFYIQKRRVKGKAKHIFPPFH